MYPALGPLSAPIPVKCANTGRLKLPARIQANTERKYQNPTDFMVLPQELIPLRPHHLVCLQYFIGKGYSARFTSKTTRVLTYLKQHPTLACIQIVQGADMLCQSCPNLHTQCKTAQQHDQGYLQALHLTIRQQLSFQEAIERFQRYVNDAVFHTICGSCLWYDLCSSLRQKRMLGILDA